MEYSRKWRRLPSSNDVVKKNLPPTRKEEEEAESKLHTNNMEFVTEYPSFSVAKSDMVEVIPTGNHPTSEGFKYMLSNLDQIVPYPIEVIMEFNKNSSVVHADVGAILKQSLEKALEEYYPLAGRLKVGSDGKMVVDCSRGEGGVPFVEAFSGDEMAVALGDITVIDQKVVRKLVYSNHRPYETILDVPPLAVQVTRFRCGGMILGVTFNHVIIDGVGFTDFMRSWSEIARGSPLSIRPHLDRSILSPRKPPEIHFSHPEYSQFERPLIPLLSNRQQEKIVTKSFCFGPTHLSRLRKIAMEHSNKNGLPTTFELISALAWICWTRAKKVSPGETTQIVTAVDGRQRLNPPIPEGYFGNGIVWSCARSRAQELTSQPFSYAVGIVHDAIKEVTEDYIRSTIDFHEVTRKPLEVDNTVWITKWSRLPTYEIDFGWGAAPQVAPGAILENLVVLLSHGKDSKNLVISLTLPVEAMEIFQELVQSQLSDD